MKEICTLLVKLHIIFSRMQRVNQHARPSIIQVGCPTCCYQVCALDHANGGAAGLDYGSEHCHRNVSCGSNQTNSERIILLNSWYQIDIFLYSNRYLFVRSKIGGQKWQPHILCKTMSFFTSRLTPWFAWQWRAPAQKTTRAEMQILYPLLSQYLRHSILNNGRSRYEKCIVQGNKNFWIR